MNKAVVSIASALVGTAVGAGVAVKVVSGEKEKIASMSDKHLALFLMMNQWVKVKQEGKNLAEYFEKNNYHRIAVYGMSYAGETLVAELKGTGIEVAYGIDRMVDSVCSDIAICLPEDNLGEVDAVVITAVTFFSEIERELVAKVDCPVISLEDILYEI